MKEPKKINIKKTGSYESDSLTVSHLSDTQKCHIMTSSYGEVTSASLNKTQIRRLVSWLNKWLKFKETQEDGK